MKLFILPLLFVTVLVPRISYAEDDLVASGTEDPRDQQPFYEQYNDPDFGNLQRELDRNENVVGRPTIQWLKGHFSMGIRNGSERGTVVAEAKRVMSWTERRYFPDTKMEYRDVEVDTTCDMVCTSAGKGKSELWNEFYRATDAQKITILEKNIGGVGVPTATALVKNKYFHEKPKNWGEFAAEVRRAGKAGVINKDVVTKILETNGIKNAEILGYGEGQSVCKQKTTPCKKWENQLVSIPFTNHVDEEKTRIVQTKKFNVEINVTGAKLLPMEKEDELKFSIDEQGKVFVDNSNGGLNLYSLSSKKEGGRTVIDAVATSRIRRDLHANEVDKKNEFTLVDGKPKFILNIDPAYLPKDEDPDAQLVLNYKVQVCKYGWTGTCGLSSWKDHKRESVPLHDAQTTLDLSLPPHHKGQVVYSITRANSKYFNDNPTRESTTDDVKMPKK